MAVLALGLSRSLRFFYPAIPMLSYFEVSEDLGQAQLRLTSSPAYRTERPS